VTGVKYPQHFQKTTGEKGYFPQQIFMGQVSNLSMRWRVLQHHTRRCVRTYGKRQNNQRPFFMKYSVSPSTMHPVIIAFSQ